MSDDDICAVVNTENPLAEKTELTMKDLAGQKLIMNTGNYSLQQQILTSLDSSGIPYHIAIRCDQIETSLALAGRNYGISFASRSAARYYDLPNTAVIPITDLPSRGIYAVHSKDPEYYPVLKDFLGHILKDTEQPGDL
jgi:DNA-binding transcriptional LysR family regulator